MLFLFSRASLLFSSVCSSPRFCFLLVCVSKSSVILNRRDENDVSEPGGTDCDASKAQRK